MHLIENYAAVTRLRTSKPKPVEHFFPLPFDNKYIIFTSSTKMHGKVYPYWEEVFDILKPLLGNIKIVQVGTKDDIVYRGVDLNLCGRTSYYELVYLIKNATLSLSSDTAQVHLSDAFNIPLVALYGLTDPKISGGFFGDKSKQIYLEPDRTQFPPTFNPNDQSVANIMPETVVKAVLKQLGIEANVPHVTKFFGSNFLNKSLDVIPNMVVHPKQFTGSIINIRADYEFSEDGVYQNLVNYRSVIITNKPLNVEILKQLRHNIHCIAYILDENHNLDFVKQLKKAAIPYDLSSYKDQDWINTLKFDYCDYGIIHKKTHSELPEECKLSGPISFKSNRFILSKGAIFLSIWHYKNNIPVVSFEENYGEIPDVTEFDWKRDLDQYWIFNLSPQ